MGKSSSKLKTPRRSQSMAWNFRLSALNRNKIMFVEPEQQQQYHMDIGGWLELLDLPQYKQSFSHFLGVEELIYLCESDIKYLGVRNSAHRARIVSSLVALREKYERGTSSTSTTLTRKPTTRKSQRYSMSVVQDKHQQNDTPMVQGGNTKLHYPNGQKSIGSIMKLNRCYLPIISLEHQSPEQNPTETRNLFFYKEMNNKSINQPVIIITIHKDEPSKIHRIL